LRRSPGGNAEFDAYYAALKRAHRSLPPHSRFPRGGFLHLRRAVVHGRGERRELSSSCGVSLGPAACGPSGGHGSRDTNQGSRRANQGLRHVNQGSCHVNEGSCHVDQGLGHANEGLRHANEGLRHVNQDLGHVNEDLRQANEGLRHANQGSCHVNQGLGPVDQGSYSSDLGSYYVDQGSDGVELRPALQGGPRLALPSLSRAPSVSPRSSTPTCSVGGRERHLLRSGRRGKPSGRRGKPSG